MHDLNQHKIAALLPQRAALLTGGLPPFVWRVRCAPGPGWCTLPAWSR